MQLGAHRRGGRWLDSGCPWKESGHDCRWTRKNVVKGGSEAYGLKWEWRWRGNRRVGWEVGSDARYTPRGHARGGRDRYTQSSGQRQEPGTRRFLWHWKPRGQVRPPGMSAGHREAPQDLSLGAASGDAAGWSEERTQLPTGSSNAVTGDLGDFRGVTMFLSLRALVSLHIDC